MFFAKVRHREASGSLRDNDFGSGRIAGTTGP